MTAPAAAPTLVERLDGMTVAERSEHWQSEAYAAITLADRARALGLDDLAASYAMLATAASRLARRYKP